jgi:cytochrome b561|tara:strand:- start:382 stop:546 length:165 start_codon:yes stop_codon:yes gene_type:complete
VENKTNQSEFESADALLSDPEPWESWETQLVTYSILVAVIGLVLLGILINWLIL